MARYHAVKPVFENPKEERERKIAKKKEIIWRIFTYSFAALLVLGIGITGTNYENDLVFGLGNIFMGVITLFHVAFTVYTEAKGWYKSVVYWDKRKFLSDAEMDKEDFKKELGEHKFVMILISILFFGLAVYFFVAGARALLGIR